jgi:hypothetical protein
MLASGGVIPNKPPGRDGRLVELVEFAGSVPFALRSAGASPSVLSCGGFACRLPPWFRGAAGLCGLLVALSGLLSWPLVAADIEQESDVDLTLAEGGSGFTNSVGMKLVRIPRGKFMMGAFKEFDERFAVNNETPRIRLRSRRTCTALGVNSFGIRHERAASFPAPVMTRRSRCLLAAVRLPHRRPARKMPPKERYPDRIRDQSGR